MIALDTNVWVRYLVDDDPVQARRAYRLLESVEAVFVPKTVLLELEWVLRAVYEIPGEKVRGAILHLAGLPMIVMEQPAQVAQAIEWNASGVDFADAMHLAACPASTSLHTFDAALIRRGRRLGLPVATVPSA